MKKLVLLSLMILFLTGCKVNYNLTYDGKEFIETTSYKTDKSLIKNDNIKETMKNWLCVNFDCMQNLMNSYSIKTFYENDEPVLRASKSYPSLQSLKNTIVGWTCYESVEVSETDKTITLLAKGKFRCFNTYYELEEVNINFESKYDVLSSNADKHENGKYTWNITRENAEQKEIKLEISKNKNYNINQYIMYLLYAFIGIIVLVIIYVGIRVLINRKG